MKRLFLILGLAVVFGTANMDRAAAEVRVNINIDIQPAWGPSGYNYAEFYYIPEINIYYDIVNRLFWYPLGNRWMSAVYLPLEYAYYDFYSLYKVVLNNILSPWRFNVRHRSLYAHYCYNYRQVPIYYMSDHRYYRARNNYHGWVEPRYMPRDNGRPAYRDFSRNEHTAKINRDAPRRPADNRASADRNIAGNSTPNRTGNINNNRSSANERTTPGASNNRSNANARTTPSTSNSRDRANTGVSERNSSRNNAPSAKSAPSSGKSNGNSSVSSRSRSNDKPTASRTSGSANNNTRRSESGRTRN